MLCCHVSLPLNRLTGREYASGGELINYIANKGHLSEKEARNFFRQMVSALDHCHTANVVHRDLKLENLLLSENRSLLISDFGLGRVFKEDQLLRTFCGTPNYGTCLCYRSLICSCCRACKWNTLRRAKVRYLVDGRCALHHDDRPATL
jgi:Protein kinase domain